MRQRVAAGTRALVDQHHLEAEDRAERSLEGLAFAGRPPREQRSVQQIDDVVGDEPAAVEALVDDDGVARELREEVASEIAVPATGCVGQVDVGDAAAGELGDSLSIGLDPGTVAQGGFARDGNDRDRPGAFHLGPLVQDEHD